MLRSLPRRRAHTGIPGRRRSWWRWLADIALTVAILGLLILLSARLDRVATESHTGRPRVSDGDSLMFGGEKVRLLGLDAPEIEQMCRKSAGEYACGRQARDALVGFIGGREVVCTGRQRDRYGRLLGSCRAGGEDVNARMVESGWAVAYGDFEAEEATARQNGAGLWDGSFERPRDWREQHGGMAESEHAGLAQIVNWLRQVLRF